MVKLYLSKNYPAEIKRELCALKKTWKDIHLMSAVVISSTESHMCLCPFFLLACLHTCLSNLSTLMIFFCNERSNKASCYTKCMNGVIWKVPTELNCDGQSHP